MRLEALPERGDGVRVLTTVGELDVRSAPSLLPGLPSLVEGARGVVLDLSPSTFFDSSGVRLVDGLARECASTGAPFRVVAPVGTPGRHVLELVGMADALVDEDLPSALASVGAG